MTERPETTKRLYQHRSPPVVRVISTVPQPPDGSSHEHDRASLATLGRTERGHTEIVTSVWIPTPRVDRRRTGSVGYRRSRRMHACPTRIHVTRTSHDTTQRGRHHGRRSGDGPSTEDRQRGIHHACPHHHA